MYKKNKGLYYLWALLKAFRRYRLPAFLFHYIPQWWSKARTHKSTSTRMKTAQEQEVSVPHTSPKCAPDEEEQTVASPASSRQRTHQRSSTTFHLPANCLYASLSVAFKALAEHTTANPKAIASNCFIDTNHADRLYDILAIRSSGTVHRRKSCRQRGRHPG